MYDDFKYTDLYPQYENQVNKIIGIRNNKYYLISLNKNSSIEILKPKDPILSVGFAPSQDTSNYLIQTTAEEIKRKYRLDSVDKTPISSYPHEFSAIYIYRIYKSGKVGLWDKLNFIEPSYNSITDIKIFRRKVYIIASINNKYGIINQKEEVIVPFKYDELLNSWDDYVITKNQNKYGAIMFNTVYKPIACLYDKIEYVSTHWSFAIFKVQKNGKVRYVGENGVEYFK